MVLRGRYALLIAAASAAAQLVLAACAPASVLAEEWTAPRLLNFPFQTQADLRPVNTACHRLRGQLAAFPGGRRVPAADFLETVEAFTQPQAEGTQSLQVESFATSMDPALVRLRGEVALAPPPGGAVVRTYTSVQRMPSAIRALFGAETGGITYGCRYVAVLSGDKSAQEVADITSHELVHAYISSCLGEKRDLLPTWFHEGAALYLSRGQAQYISRRGPFEERVSYTPRDYSDYRLAFRYLQARDGRAGVSRFIRDSVRSASVDAPLRQSAGVPDWDALRKAALAWWWRRQLAGAVAVAFALVAIGVAASGLTRRRERLVDEALDLVEMARYLARSGRMEEAEERLLEAQSRAPFAREVRLAVQQAKLDLLL